MTMEELRNELDKLKESRDYWMDRAAKAEKKFASFREMMKGLVVLVE